MLLRRAFGQEDCSEGGPGAVGWEPGFRLRELQASWAFVWLLVPAKVRSGQAAADQCARGDLGLSGTMAPLEH